MKRTSKYTDKKAFTLIELLVVISIIALLMGILMPVLSKVREQAKKLSCQSNVRQLTLAFDMYRAEHNNKGVVSPGGGEFWFHQLSPYIGNKDFAIDPAKHLEGAMEVLRCPSTKDPVKAAPEQATGTATNMWRYGNFGKDWDNVRVDGDFYVEGSYGLNAWVGGWKISETTGDGGRVIPGRMHGYSFRKDIPSASDIPVFADCIWTGYWPQELKYDPVPTELEEGTTGKDVAKICLDRHNKGINLSFTDGHVEFSKLSNLWNYRYHKYYKKTPDVTVPKQD